MTDLNNSLPSPENIFLEQSNTPEVKYSSPSNSNFFKYLFYVSLAIFILVAGANIYNLVNQSGNNSFIPNIKINLSSPTPIPTTVPESFCDLHGQKYKIGDTFPSEDGCNTCSCTSSLDPLCTDKVCLSTPSATIKPTSKPATTSADLTVDQIK